jgi:serine/threonine protein kinase
MEMDITTPKNQNSGGFFEAKSLQNITVGSRLGAGHYGEVFKGTWNGTTDVALKSFKKEGMQTEFEEEIKLLFKLNHPNIVRAIGTFMDVTGRFYLVLEYCPHGSLDAFLHINGNELTLKDRYLMSLQFAAGCNYLESVSVVHRDLAARNLLVDGSKDNYTIKISDMGLSRNTSYYKSDSKSIPYRWSSPETILYGTSTHLSDVWSFGVVLWEIFSNAQIPFAKLTNDQVVDQVANGNERLSKPEFATDEIFEIMTQCWKKNPKDRPSFAKLYQMIQHLVQEQGYHHHQQQQQKSSFSMQSQSMYPT